VFVRSGIRHDYVMADKESGVRFIEQLAKNHVSGQLRTAPEHICQEVLSTMGKPSFKVHEQFCEKFYAASKKARLEQYVVPYLMSSHPGSTLNDAIELALYLKKNRIRPEQVQDFYPTPGTISTAMFYTELDPYTLKPVYVAKTPEEKAMQRVLLQYYKAENRSRVIEVLVRAKRRDLIGTSPDCLVVPDREYAQRMRQNSVRKDDEKWQNKKRANPKRRR
jgi:uncharacterized radical SAM protein YgiQ